MNFPVGGTSAITRGMPELCRFLGIVIRIHNNDHAPPHFHVRYASDSAITQISNLEILSGDLPDRILRLIKEWGSLHQEELMVAWQQARSNQKPSRIEPLE